MRISLLQMVYIDTAFDQSRRSDVPKLSVVLCESLHDLKIGFCKARRNSSPVKNT